ncbi:uncharacterized protein [Miscanthus floridulus]|uniref:uncharacterized protein n=1 Tax=Miscanthus floridulus TaxID=154761 RepID=UPI003458205C
MSTGISFPRSKSRTQRPGSLRTDMTRSTFLTLRTRSQGAMMIFPMKFLTLMLRSLRTGLIRKMVNGLPQPSQTSVQGLLGLQLLNRLRASIRAMKCSCPA